MPLPNWTNLENGPKIVGCRIELVPPKEPPKEPPPLHSTSPAMAIGRRMRAFRRWMKCQSIEYSDALDFIIQQEDQQVWVKALCDLHEGDLIATIPKHSCLTVKSSAACRLIDDFCLEGYMALSVALMYEKSLGQNSPWFGYLQLLPDCNPDVPLLWSLDEIDHLLFGTELHKVRFY